MSALALWSVIDIVALIAGLAIYLFIVGGQLKAIAADIDSLIDHGLTVKEFRDAQALYEGAKRAGLV